MIEPRKMTKNSPVAFSRSSDIDLLSEPILRTVSYITSPIASLKIDSPKTMEYKLTSASISLKTASTDTGSVALIKLPKAKASFHENSGERLVWPTTQNNAEEVKIAMKVPKNE